MNYQFIADELNTRGFVRSDMDATGGLSVKYVEENLSDLDSAVRMHGYGGKRLKGEKFFDIGRRGEVAVAYDPGVFKRVTPKTFR